MSIGNSISDNPNVMAVMVLRSEADKEDFLNLPRILDIVRTDFGYAGEYDDIKGVVKDVLSERKIELDYLLEVTRDSNHEEYPRLPKEVSREIASRLDRIGYTYRGESYHEWSGVLERRPLRT